MGKNYAIALKNKSGETFEMARGKYADKKSAECIARALENEVRRYLGSDAPRVIVQSVKENR